MSLKDFDKIDKNSMNKKSNRKEIKIDDFDLETIHYYMNHIDELMNCVKQSYYNYINAKLTYELKKDTYQTSINWNEENTLRESNNLPKVTTQTQRDSVINLKIKNLNIELKSCELKYNTYKKIFNFIDENFDFLINMDNENEKMEDDVENEKNN